ncbi:MAG: 50S ribosomal protein L17 [Candidatus Latescibacterota bacterium]|jgi:large subunit ribosomal protein L17
MLSNMVTSLLDKEVINTTEARAKELRRLAEHMITFAKRNDLHARRQVLRVIANKEVVAKLFGEIGPRYQSRNGGYTRIVKIGPRHGDGALMSLIELVDRVGGSGRKERTKEAATGEPEAATEAKSEAKPEGGVTG